MDESCTSRQKLTIVDSAGDRVAINQCIAARAPTFGQSVTPDVCAGCMFRSAKPPKLERVINHPKPAAKLPECDDRLEVLVVKCCGQTIRQERCKSGASSVNGQVVTAETCNNCPVRRVASKTGA